MANKDVLNVEHVQELIDRGKKQGLISYREIMDALQDVDLSPDQIDEIYESFAELGVDIIPETGDGDPLDAHALEDAGEIDQTEEDFDLSVPDSVGLDDPGEDVPERNRPCSAADGGARNGICQKHRAG